MQRAAHKVKIYSVVFLIVLSLSIYQEQLVSKSDYQEKNDIITLEQYNPVYVSDSELLYTPITNVSGVGSSLSGKDVLTVNDYQSLNLTYNEISGQFEDNYTIDPIAGYDPFRLNYNISSIIAKTDLYPIEAEGDTQMALGDAFSRLAIAQSFDVIWDYAVFSGAKLYLIDDGPLGGTELDLFLVKANDLTGQPNMTDILSSDINGPYTETNSLPASTIDNLPFYDFADVVLESGKYFVVANLTVVGGPKNFFWYSYSVAPLDSDTYYMDNSGVWNLQLTDHTFIPQLLPSYDNGTALAFSDLSQISLQDNSVDVPSTTSSISSTGFHLLSCDTSVELVFNNSYSFSKDVTVDTSFTAINSTSGIYSNIWTLQWSTSEADYSPYPNMERSILIFTPTDWSDSSTCYYNDTDVLSSLKTIDGYLVNLGFNISAGTFRLETMSLNYVQQLTLSDDSGPASIFSLGYWTTDTIDAFGNEGSTVNFEINVQNNEDTGSTNVTLFDPNGNILPQKIALPSNLTYIDISSYTKNGILSSGSGLYASSLTFDPSAYGSDIAGEWTAFVYWTNGTQSGLFAKKIFVEAEIVFNPSWETLPNSDVWTYITSNTILRMNGDSLRARSDFYSISEPFFGSMGQALVNATVSYTTSWGLSGNFSENGVLFNSTVPISVDAGFHTITLDASSSQSKSSKIQLNLEVFNLFSLVVDQASIEINSTDEAVLRFKLLNMTDPLQSVIYPDDFSVYINDALIAEGFYEQTIDGDWVVLTMTMQTSGTHKVTVTVSKANFKAGYLDDQSSFDYTVKVNPTEQLQLPPYLIIIIVVGGILLITLLTAVIAIPRSRKSKAPIVDVQSKAKVVGLLDSVLSMRKILFIHSETSLPVFELDIGSEHSIETALVSGFLSAVETMGKTLGGSDTGEIKRLEYRNFVVTGASSETYTVFLFSSNEVIKEFQARLFDLIMWFEYSFKIKEKVWNGKKEMFNSKKKLIEDKVAESLYLWIYFPLRFNKQKSGEIKKLDKMEQKIAEFGKKKGEVTISSLLQRYSDYEIEDTLTAVFGLVNKGILIRNQFSSFSG
ncbi:MAG: hypothetical protein GPJ51_06865 [Candidatus Heimdallarchaeota archaeon]|nr:hypothetical protein [Candidatus Heimdallarchaeota archaeon]